MKLQGKLKKIAEKYIRTLVASAGILILLGLFMLVGRNFMLVWFLDETTLDLLGENYAISFNMAYAPVQHIQKFIHIVNDNKDPTEINTEIILRVFEDSTYFGHVSYINSDSLDKKPPPGEIIWNNIEIINNEPFLVLVYGLENQSSTQYIEIKLSLKNVVLPRETAQGFALIQDSEGNEVLTALSSTDWKNYDHLKTAYEAEKKNTSPKLRPERTLEIEGIQYRITESTFSIGDNNFLLTLYFNDDTVNESVGIILLVLTVFFPSVGVLFFLFAFSPRLYNRPFSSDTQICNSIAQGESSSLEFKSSLRWDCENNSLNKELENVILKSIAAFANSSGGKLLIGVKDDGSILGLQNDYSTLKEASSDHFELHLRNKIDTVFGRDFSASQINCSFYTFIDGVNEGKEIAIIDIKASDDPIYVTLDHKGTKTEKFFVRSGNSSRALENISEIMRYIKKHF